MPVNLTTVFILPCRELALLFGVRVELGVVEWIRYRELTL